MAGSLLMLAAIVVFGLSQGTFDLIESGTDDSSWVFLGFVVAFAIKAPIFPVPRLAAGHVPRVAARGLRAPAPA
jgi:NADH:ubiquinone oxidoreductase subunit 4 (subunit M)